MIFLSEWLPSSGGKFRSSGQEKQEPGKFWRNTPKKIDRPEPFYGGDRPVSCIPQGECGGVPVKGLFQNNHSYEKKQEGGFNIK
jgi:hypothetical protein